MLLSEKIQQALLAKGVESMTVTAGVRPEHISFAGESGAHTITGKVDVSEMMGSEVHLHVVAGEKDIVLRIPTTDLPPKHHGGIPYGTEVHFAFRPELIHLFYPESELNLV